MVKSLTKFAMLFLLFFIISETFVADARNVVNIPCNSRIDCSDPWDCDCKLNLCFCHPHGLEKEFLHKASLEYLGEEKTTPLLKN
uniref:Nodule Cysteine-Rich (NCR) secreted peptide n=1 Tax=Cucumis melo TaxID=3656 RepID=A0A9I9E342_CUCME